MEDHDYCTTSCIICDHKAFWYYRLHAVGQMVKYLQDLNEIEERKKRIKYEAYAAYLITGLAFILKPRC